MMTLFYSLSLYPHTPTLSQLSHAFRHVIILKWISRGRSILFNFYLRINTLHIVVALSTERSIGSTDRAKSLVFRSDRGDDHSGRASCGVGQQTIGDWMSRCLVVEQLDRVDGHSAHQQHSVFAFVESQLLSNHLCNCIHSCVCQHMLTILTISEVIFWKVHQVFSSNPRVNLTLMIKSSKILIPAGSLAPNSKSRSRNSLMMSCVHSEDGCAQSRSFSALSAIFAPTAA